ncbi:uncharacterized protein LOC131007904 [Salvia miltiorrhiza]|uniref:uncharacterized protein LOC131007904 n=1 Tax=Salvia miltiorrhiza TaxID=226208 RepID=UPI0025AC95CA|nr:uncharacterized protein LOC131007904 [Salvia miltiorrhiza]
MRLMNYHIKTLFSIVKLFDSLMNLPPSVGKIKMQLPKMPDELWNLYVNDMTTLGAEFRRRCRTYNNSLAFTSIKMTYDEALAKANKGVYTFKVQGIVRHYIQELTPKDGVPRHLQLYFYGTERELDNRVSQSEGLDYLLRNFKTPSSVAMREYYCYLFQIRTDDIINILRTGRVIQQFQIDTYVKIETQRLDFFRHNQSKFEMRAKSYQGIVESITSNGVISAKSIGKRVLLPKTFTGGPRDLRCRYMNALALVAKFGRPDIFLTMTCNPKWVEIQSELFPVEKSHNRADLYARVFRAKNEELKKEIVKDSLFGVTSTEAYDRFVSAEIPDLDLTPHLHSCVINHMMHGPCGELNPKNACMIGEKCKSYYPKEFKLNTEHRLDSYPDYKRRDDGKKVLVRGKWLDNRWVVPYNAYLLAKFDCHINVQVCTDVRSVKYLYKYVCKGNDQIAYNIVDVESTGPIDEIFDFQKSRWLCAPEAMWRIYGFDIFDMYPSVLQLHVHLSGYQQVFFAANQSLPKIVDSDHANRTQRTKFFEMNKFVEVAALNLLYQEFVEHFAALDRGLLDSDNDVRHAIHEAATYQMPSALQKLFAITLVFNSPSDPKNLWIEFRDALSADIMRDYLLDHVEGYRLSLRSIDSFLQMMGHGIDEYFVVDYIVGLTREEINSCEFAAEINMLFIDGPGGTGKTFLYKAILATVRSTGDIALAVASSGVAASLLPNGRTAHSRFKILLNLDESMSCSISKNTAPTKLIIAAKLILWNEASMANRKAVEALNLLLQDLMENQLLFGGKTVVLGGDFWQTISIVRRGSREEIVDACLNMRAMEDPIFTDLLLRVGEDSPLDTLVNEIFPSFDAYSSGNVVEYVSTDYANDPSQQQYYQDYMNAISVGSLPPHVLKLKVNCPVMLLRNLNPLEGLCNGTRLIVRDLGRHVNGAVIAVGTHSGECVLIPRIPLELDDTHICPITFKRLQFPLRLCFAISINKSQGQTSDRVGVYLPHPVFSHGQLYVALSRVRTSSSIKFLIRPPVADMDSTCETRNVVYTEILQAAT